MEYCFWVSLDLGFPSVLNGYCYAVERRRTNNDLSSQLAFFLFEHLQAVLLPPFCAAFYTENRSLKYDKNDMNYHQTFSVYDAPGRPGFNSPYRKTIFFESD
jgi:hypothetical protein